MQSRQGSVASQSQKEQGRVETMQQSAVGGTLREHHVVTTHLQGPPVVTETKFASTVHSQQGNATITSTNRQISPAISKTTTTSPLIQGTTYHQQQGTTSYYQQQGITYQQQQQQGTTYQQHQQQQQQQGINYQQQGASMLSSLPYSTVTQQAHFTQSTTDKQTLPSSQVFRSGNQKSGNNLSEQYLTNDQSTTTTTNTYLSGARVVKGEERVVGYNTLVKEDRIISERIVEHEIKIPKRVIREEIIEKVIVVPETITREEVIEEVQRVKETIIEVAKPIIQEKIVEVPEIEYRDKIVEKVEKIVQEKIRQVPKIEYQERIVEVPKYINQERIVEVPEIEYRDVIIEKIVEIPEVREQVIVKEVPIPQYIEKPTPQYVNVEQAYDVERSIPVPIEAVTTFEYQLARFRPRVHKVQYPLYVPRFVEVPVSAELFDANVVASLEAQASKLQLLSSTQAIGLCEVENMATEFRRNDVTSFQASSADLQQALTTAWKSGRLTLHSSAVPATMSLNSVSAGQD